MTGVIQRGFHTLFVFISGDIYDVGWIPLCSDEAQQLNRRTVVLLFASFGRIDNKKTLVDFDLQYFNCNDCAAICLSGRAAQSSEIVWGKGRDTSVDLVTFREIDGHT